MGLIIVAIYTLCNDLLIQHRHREDLQAKMSDAKVMTTARYTILQRQSTNRILSTQRTRVYSQYAFRHTIQPKPSQNRANV